MTAMTIATSAPLALAASLLLAVGLTATALAAEHPRPAEMPMADSAPKNEPSGTVGTAVGTPARGRQNDDLAWRAIEDRLEMRITVDFQGQALSETMSFLGQSSGVKFVIDPKVMAANPHPITLKVHDMKLRYALDFILSQNSLQYTLRDGSCYITFAGPDWHRKLENQLEQEITLDFENKDFGEVVSFLQKVTNTTVVLDPRVMVADLPPITIKVDRMKLKDVFDFIQKLTALQYTPINGGIFFTLAEPGWRRHVEDLLMQEITLDFKNKDFGEVVSFLQKITPANVVLDPRVMAAKLSPTTLQVERMRLKHLLEFILRQNSLQYSLRNEAIVITLADPARLALRRALKTRGVHLEGASVTLQSTPASVALHDKLEQRLTAKFTETSSNEVFKFLRLVTGMNLIISPEIAQHEANITLKVTDMRLKDVLIRLSELQELSISEENGAVYVEASAAQPDALSTIQAKPVDTEPRVDQTTTARTAEKPQAATVTAERVSVSSSTVQAKPNGIAITTMCETA
jgi:type II secretory pathway component GspD/PulD (secretin)